MIENNITIVKAGTAVVSNRLKTELDLEAIGYIGEDIASINDDSDRRGGRAVLVASGAVTAGLQRLDWSRCEVEENIDLKRVASMAGNTALAGAFEEATGMVAALDLPTHNDLNTNESWSHLKRAVLLSLNRGLLPIFNEGDARSSEELETTLKIKGQEFIRFGDNDWLAGHFAVQLEAKTLVFLTNSDGVLQNGKTKDYIDLNSIDDFILEHVDDSEVSNGGMTSKLQVAKFALTNCPSLDVVFIGNGKVRHMSTQGVESNWGTTVIR